MLLPRVKALRQKDDELIAGEPHVQSAVRSCLLRGIADSLTHCRVASLYAAVRSRLSEAEAALSTAELERDEAVTVRRQIESDLRHITAHRQQLAHLRSALHHAKGRATQHHRAHSEQLQGAAVAASKAAEMQSPLRMAHLLSPSSHPESERSTHASHHADTTASSNVSSHSSQSASFISPARTPAPNVGKAIGGQPMWFRRLHNQQ